MINKFFMISRFFMSDINPWSLGVSRILGICFNFWSLRKCENASNEIFPLWRCSCRSIKLPHSFWELLIWITFSISKPIIELKVCRSVLYSNKVLNLYPAAKTWHVSRQTPTLFFWLIVSMRRLKKKPALCWFLWWLIELWI